MSSTEIESATEDVVAKWKLLGINLCAPHTTLEAIDANYHKVENKKSEMIQTWLTGETMPTWSAVVEALCSPSIDLPRAADKVSVDHSKSNLQNHIII